MKIGVALRAAAVATVLLTGAGTACAHRALRDGEPNPQGWLPSDPTGEEQRAATTSLLALRKFLTDAAWDDRLEVAVACHANTGDWKNNVATEISHRIYSAIDRFPWPTQRDKRVEEVRAQGMIIGAEEMGRMVGGRIGEETFCPAVFSDENMRWMTDAAASGIGDPSGSFSFIEIPNDVIGDLRASEIGEVSVQCGIRGQAWLDDLHAGQRQGAVKIGSDAAIGRAFRDGYVAMAQRWSSWERTQFPDGSCSRLTGGALRWNDRIVGRDH